MAAGERPAPQDRHRNTPPGPAVDSSGQTVLDPTHNVMDLVRASERRQDDLRYSSERRQDDLRAVDAAHVREILALRAEYEDRISRKESARLDAIRSVDARAVADSAAVQVTQAGALAAQVTASADAARANVSAAAAAQATALKAETDPLRKDIADLRQVQYEAAGGKLQVLEGRGSNTQMIAVTVALFGLVNVGVGLLAMCHR